MAVKLIRPPETKDLTLFLRTLFLRTERKIVNEITRKRTAGYVDYAEVAALERVQETLRRMQDECWEYVPEMIEKIFYRATKKDAAGYRNARVLTAPQLAAVDQLANNLLGEIAEASETAYKTVQGFYTIGRLENDPFRATALRVISGQEASGIGWAQTSAQMVREFQNQGITAFEDKAGRRWTLSSYCNMCARTTARQAEVAAILTADDYDLWQIVKIGSTCPVCAPLEGRVYSKSGTSPDYPPLSLAFGKVDPAGPESLDNTYLNIHPNCLHSLVKYTTIGKSAAQIQKDKDFSDPRKNPITRDPRTKKQIKAYEEKERNRRKLMADIRQHKEYRAVLGKDIPKDFAKFREMKYNNAEKWKYSQELKKYLEKYPTSSKKFYDAGEELKALGIKKGVLLPVKPKQAFILPEGKRDPYHIMHRMLGRNITDDEIRSYMTNAKAMFVQWGGKRQVFYGNSGIAVITKVNEDWIYKTAWKRADFDEETEQILEVVKKHGI